jgi:hypothetical protein
VLIDRVSEAAGFEHQSRPEFPLYQRCAGVVLHDVDTSKALLCLDWLRAAADYSCLGDFSPVIRRMELLRWSTDQRTLNHLSR